MRLPSRQGRNNSASGATGFGCARPQKWYGSANRRVNYATLLHLCDSPHLPNHLGSQAFGGASRLLRSILGCQPPSDTFLPEGGTVEIEQLQRQTAPVCRFRYVISTFR